MNYQIMTEESGISVLRAINYPEKNYQTIDLVLMLLKALSDKQKSEEITLVKPPFVFETIALENGQVVPFERRMFDGNEQIFIYYRK